MECARIERGVGAVDAATDLVDLAVLHTDRGLVGAVALRDRLWTLLVQTHDWFEQIAGARWGQHLGEHVPRLK
jgi:hypothetical protein